jgi:hypothetical protein
MRFSLQVPVILMLSCLSANAEDSLAPKTQEKQEKLEIGQGIICDSLQQVERYVALRGNGAETNVALQTVNNEAHTPVCSVALVMFSAGQRVAGLAVQGRLLSIMQINVHAFSEGPVWMKIPTTIRYTVTAEKGQVV